MDAYIVAAKRSAVGKANRGTFRFLRPDDLAMHVIRDLMDSVPELEVDRIDDLIVGNAMPEAEHGLNVGRLISLMSFDTDKVPGMTVNRYCSSGLETISIAAAKIHAGMADCIIAGGTESMSLIPMGGWRVVPNARIGKNNPGWYWGMGLTAEEVANRYNVSREDQDEFAMKSHQKAALAIQEERLQLGVTPVEVEEVFLDGKERKTRKKTLSVDEGVRPNTNLEALARLRPVFAADGSVTAGNASQTSDGAAFVVVMSEKMVKELNVKPIARLLSYAAVGVEPEIMGIGPVKAIPKALKLAGMSLQDIDLIELNEAFASQSLAVIREAGLNPDIVNVNGGAIALGHPLGCTGAKLSVQLFNEMRLRKQKYGIVTMCVGTGQGAAGVYELLD
ncbi:acetyl-CoA C-acyltransferase [bacterium SCSIO 12741]|nr:acetyl-CoA C-acyltransferase [bacterium SCSIO 12741]